MEMENLPKRRLSYEHKLAWLKRRDLMDKDKPSASTVNRLYSFYHRNPLSTPLAVAYGLKHRVEQKATKKGGEAVVRTGRGMIPVKRYVLQVRKRVDRETRESVTHRMTLNRYLSWSKKVQDIFTLPIGVMVKEDNYKDQMQVISKVFEEDVRPTVRRFIQVRRPLYEFGTYLIGARLHFVTSPLKTTVSRDIGNLIEGDSTIVTSFHTTVAYISLDSKDWLNRLMMRLYQSSKIGFDKVFQYKNSWVLLKDISFVVITRTRATGLERLRGRPK
jgi:hypothetical protein